MTPMIVEHPLLQHKISLLRNKQTGTKEFRDLVGEIATLLCYEATRDLPLEEVEIETPLCKTKARHLSGKKVGIVPILRAGLGLVDGVLRMVPSARVGHIGMFREETRSHGEFKRARHVSYDDVLVAASAFAQRPHGSVPQCVGYFRIPLRNDNAEFHIGRRRERCLKM